MKTAIILSAGRGERLKPLTDHTPKALCTLQNIPLIEHHVKNLARAGVERVVINHAHLGGKIRHHLGDGRRFGITIVYSPEPPGGLETGGGIVNALPLLGTAPFFSINADIFTDYDFTMLQLPQNRLAHLVLVPKPADRDSGDFGLSPTTCVNNHEKAYVFSGIACYHPQLFSHCQVGRYSITPLLRQLANDQQVSGELHARIWFDIGSLARLQTARDALANF